ncbi:MAG: enoyl-CoA hydratase-related protein [bacterium]
MARVRLEKAAGVARVTIDRPEVRNAFDDAVVHELRETFEELARGEDLRAVVLAGAGKVFCAGADAESMRRSAGMTEAQNRSSARDMAEMFRAIDTCPVPVIGRLQGAAMGGGVGLVACCDVVVAADDAKVAFSEARLGVVPAVISAFVLPKIGASAARRYFLTAETFSSMEARAMGLVHEVVPADALDTKIAEVLAAIAACGPRAVREAKRLVRSMGALSGDAALDHAASVIARLRASAEGQEGLAAFLERRKPAF